MLPSPDFKFEDNFAEYDPYWLHVDGSDDDDPNPDVNPESDQSFLDRIQRVLSEIFENHKDATCRHISFALSKVFFC
jgi:broad specificity phosphatase PhoE